MAAIVLTQFLERNVQDFHSVIAKGSGSLTNVGPIIPRSDWILIKIYIYIYHLHTCTYHIRTCCSNID